MLPAGGDDAAAVAAGAFLERRDLIIATVRRVGIEYRYTKNCLLPPVCVSLFLFIYTFALVSE